MPLPSGKLNLRDRTVLKALAHYRITPLTPRQVKERAERGATQLVLLVLSLRGVELALEDLTESGHVNALRHSEGYRYTITEHGRRASGASDADEPASMARMGLDLLLARFPTRDVARIHSPGEEGLGLRSPWLTVRFDDGDEYAIWKETGHVYDVVDGAVGDDPLMENPAYRANDCPTIR